MLRKVATGQSMPPNRRNHAWARYGMLCSAWGLGDLATVDGLAPGLL